MIIAGLVSIGVNAEPCQQQPAGRPVAVATSAAAIVAAKIAWDALYRAAPTHSAFSPAMVAKGEPYVAILEDGVWHVFGTLPKGTIGGTPEASICAVDGSVVATLHGQ